MGKTLGFPVNLVRDILVDSSKSQFFAPTGNDIWEKIKSLFNAMRDGGIFPPNHTINRFNGGLFESNSRLESLTIPNRVFCSKGQGESPEAIVEIKNSLLYLSASYNFGAEGSAREKTITLYALGRIFEQSITELEFMEAEADAAQTAIAAGKSDAQVATAIKKAPSIAKLSKRKRTGVYYTPEWVTSYIVREVVGARLADERERLGLEFGVTFTDRQITTFRKNIGVKSVEKNVVGIHIKKLDEYQEFLENIKIVDPACGSGAFLIQSLQFLIPQHEAIAEERKRVDPGRLPFEQDATIREILTNNLYGVDLSPESVEITQLALWLNTARKGKPLSTLDHHIREGNSLVGPDFHTFFENNRASLFSELDADTQERINVFDWQATFPEVFGEEVPPERRGFDCVVGNPPYVKLQNYRKIKPDESDYLLHHANDAGIKIYQSTQTGNADLYLPFIEKGISLINRAGRMGYIAPNVWHKNEYGEGLRRQLAKSRRLDRWIDFKSFQVFDEATVYTALQFFTGTSQTHLAFHLAHDGDLGGTNWSAPIGNAPFASLSDEDAWILLYEREWRLLNRLNQECKRLDEICPSIIVGIQTSADWFYHLDRSEEGKFYQTKKQPGNEPPDEIQYEIEPEIMKPLVSGTEAKRYLTPDTPTYLLFPYNLSEESPRLWTAAEMQGQFPNAWAYLKRYEAELRSRESNKMDVDDGWWGYNYPKNLDKHEYAKLGVAETVPSLRLFADGRGEFYFNNVRVNGILPSNPSDLYFVLGILNSPTANWVFTKIAKPKDNGYYESNKQFIAPLPIPNATGAQKTAVAELAERLQEKHTARWDAIEKLQTRLDSPNCLEVDWQEDWLWAELKSVAEIKAEAPATITVVRERTAWAKAERERRLTGQHEKIDAKLRAGMKLAATADEDALSVHAGDITLLTRYGLPADEALFLAALWRQILRNTNVTKKFDGKKLAKKLLNFRSTEDANFRQAILDIDTNIETLDAEISAAESKINKLIYKLYKLTRNEIKLVEAS